MDRDEVRLWYRKAVESSRRARDRDFDEARALAALSSGSDRFDDEPEEPLDGSRGRDRIRSYAYRYLKYHFDADFLAAMLSQAIFDEPPG